MAAVSTVALLLLQAGAQPASAVPADNATRWSILAPQCASDRSGSDDIVVCGNLAPPPRLPLPDERGPPDRPMASNPNASGAGALAASAAPCATRSEGCTVGIDLIGMGVAAIRGIGKLVDPDSCCEEPGEAKSLGLLLRDAAGVVKRTAEKPDKSKRIPIEL